MSIIEVCVDYIRILLMISPKLSVSVVMGYLKGKSHLIIRDKWEDISIEIEHLNRKDII